MHNLTLEELDEARMEEAVRRHRNSPMITEFGYYRRLVVTNWSPNSSLIALRKALAYADQNICRHDTTMRGGMIWTICEDCGEKWADDEGGFKPSPWGELYREASDALNQLPGAGND